MIKSHKSNSGMESFREKQIWKVVEIYFFQHEIFKTEYPLHTANHQILSDAPFLWMTRNWIMYVWKCFCIEFQHTMKSFGSNLQERSYINFCNFLFDAKRNKKHRLTYTNTLKLKITFFLAPTSYYKWRFLYLKWIVITISSVYPYFIYLEYRKEAVNLNRSALFI